MQHYDIIVVGAGPGGSAAAGSAAKAGFKTLLLEKQKLGTDGRYKPCGGAMGWELVERSHYPIDSLDRIIDTFNLHHFSGSKYLKNGKGAVVWRSTFDLHLTNIARKFGATVQEEEPLLQIKKQTSPSNHYLITTSKADYTCDFVIAADGVTSHTLKQLGWKNFPSKDLVLTITQEHESDSQLISEKLGKENIHLFFGKQYIDTGYGWLFPKNKTITVGWGNRLSQITNTKKEFQKFLDYPFVKNILSETTCIRHTPYLIPVGVREIIFQENVFAVGDAGGFVDPISGKGIPYAMLSGKIAIESIKKFREMDYKGLHLGIIYRKALNDVFLTVLEKKVSMRARILESDENIKIFLELWQTNRTSEILEKNLL